MTLAGHLCGLRAGGSTWLASCHSDFGVRNLDIRASIQGSRPSWSGSPPISYNSPWLQHLKRGEVQWCALRPKHHLQHLTGTLLRNRKVFRSKNRFISLEVIIHITFVFQMHFFYFWNSLGPFCTLLTMAHCTRPRWWVWCGIMGRGKVLRENLPQCDFVQYESHITWWGLN